MTTVVAAFLTTIVIESRRDGRPFSRLRFSAGSPLIESGTTIETRGPKPRHCGPSDRWGRGTLVKQPASMRRLLSQVSFLLRGTIVCGMLTPTVGAAADESNDRLRVIVETDAGGDP